MADSTIRSLQSAVRRHLWRGEFLAAARLALWGSSGLMLLAVTVHLTVRPVGVEVVVIAIIALWTSMMARAVWRRPSDSACAIWADRHLDGASAFGTLLEIREGNQAVPNAQAVRWLEQWAAARVPQSLHLLGRQRQLANLYRPFLSVLVCASLATIVLILPGTAPPAPQEAAATPDARGIERLPAPESLAPGGLVSALESALRTEDSRHATERREDGRAPAAGPGKGGGIAGSRMMPAGTSPTGEPATSRDPLSRAAGGASAAARAKEASAAAFGHDAGDSPDNRADTGVTRMPQSTIEVQRRESSERRPSPERQADMDQVASFDDDSPTQRKSAGRADPAPAAATPPPATGNAPLTLTSAAYVQAWMKASRQRR